MRNCPCWPGSGGAPSRQWPSRLGRWSPAGSAARGRSLLGHAGSLQSALDRGAVRQRDLALRCRSCCTRLALAGLDPVLPAIGFGPLGKRLNQLVDEGQAAGVADQVGRRQGRRNEKAPADRARLGPSTGAVQGPDAPSRAVGFGVTAEIIILAWTRRSSIDASQLVKRCITGWSPCYPVTSGSAIASRSADGCGTLRRAACARPSNVRSWREQPSTEGSDGRHGHAPDAEWAGRFGSTRTGQESVRAKR